MLTLLNLLKKKEFWHETHISTPSPEAPQFAWIPDPDGEQERPKSLVETPVEGKKAPHSQRRASKVTLVGCIHRSRGQLSF